MGYFLTIYTDPFLIDCNFTHTFISLTYTSPDELEKLSSTWYQEDIFQYNSGNRNQGFFGFGLGVNILGKYFNVPGKVYCYNNYIVQINNDTNTYTNPEIRSKMTFKIRCVLEISKERYEYLLENIMKEVYDTQHITPESTEVKLESKYMYHIADNNCVHWVQRHLESIGIEIFEKHTIPDKFTVLFPYISKINDIFLKFQKIDSNLRTIEGAKAFKEWVRINADIFMKSAKQAHWLYRHYMDLYTVRILYNYYIYAEEILDNIIGNHQDIKGSFSFICVDNGQLKIIEPENNYMPIILHGLDASIPCYNYTLNKYLMFILKPDEESKNIYYKYDYGKVDEDYNSAVNECYKQVLLGQTDNIKYYSQSLNKLFIKQNKENMYNV